MSSKLLKDLLDSNLALKKEFGALTPHDVCPFSLTFDMGKLRRLGCAHRCDGRCAED